ncbi:hypothetical protein Nepgr_028161 [Nepenthes gracilis]|uniref:Uncharacterized protein n=1 Tax=Nepenthes gracilis TaxID=150966 RepID=A0AAD3TBT8_NEPGR|nr:hypothetical protein Nepgr_028161 [Nepenthes gracilis]
MTKPADLMSTRKRRSRSPFEAGGLWIWSGEARIEAVNGEGDRPREMVIDLSCGEAVVWEESGRNLLKDDDREGVNQSLVVKN